MTNTGTSELNRYLLQLREADRRAAAADDRVAREMCRFDDGQGDGDAWDLRTAETARRQALDARTRTRRMAMGDGALPLTLDGEPATTLGHATEHACVVRADGRGGQVEFAWPTAVRIARTGGAFTS